MRIATSLHLVSSTSSAAKMPGVDDTHFLSLLAIFLLPADLPFMYNDFESFGMVPGALKRVLASRFFGFGAYL